MQVAQGEDMHYSGALVQAAFGCCIPLLYVCKIDGLDTVQIALMVSEVYKCTYISNKESELNNKMQLYYIITAITIDP